ncbi:MAG: hypothetical protein K5656_01885 [Lachnospiraceae bacterium]|nr:hypothetical protein [Lachnospiraceae bacterium]
MELKKLDGKSYQLINSGGARYQIRATRPVRNSSDYTIKYWKTYYQLILQNNADVTNFRKGILPDADEMRGVWTDDDQTLKYISDTYFEGKKVRQIGRGFGIYSSDCDGSGYRGDQIVIPLLVDEEAIDVTKPTPTEKKLWAAQDERNANNKIVKSFFGQNLIDLAKKYHMNLSEYNDATVGLDFNCQSDIVEFFKTAVKELIITKIKEQGLECNMDENVIMKGLNKVWLYGPVVDDIRVDKTALQ